MAASTLKITLALQSQVHKWTETYYLGPTTLPPTDAVVGTAVRALAQSRANLLGAGAWINFARAGDISAKRHTWLWYGPSVNGFLWWNSLITNGNLPQPSLPNGYNSNASELNTSVVYRFGLNDGSFALRYLAGWPDGNLQADEGLLLTPPQAGALNLAAAEAAYRAMLLASPNTALGNWQLQIKAPSPTVYGPVTSITYQPATSTLLCHLQTGSTLPVIGSKVILRGGRLIPSYRHLYQVFTVFNTDTPGSNVQLYARTPPTGQPIVVISPQMLSVGPTRSNISIISQEGVGKHKRGDKGYSVPSGKGRAGP